MLTTRRYTALARQMLWMNLAVRYLRTLTTSQIGSISVAYSSTWIRPSCSGVPVQPRVYVISCRCHRSEPAMTSLPPCLTSESLRFRSCTAVAHSEDGCETLCRPSSAAKCPPLSSSIGLPDACRCAHCATVLLRLDYTVTRRWSAFQLTITAGFNPL